MFSPITVREMLELPSLGEAQVLAGHDGLSNKVRQLNVLEAPDLAPWLAPNTVLLTSYFALASFDNRELEAFIRQMTQASVSAIVIKLERLISEVPQGFLDACEKYGMPVIAIRKDARYEDIIMEALLPLVHHKASLLDRHYRMNVVLDRWRVGDHSLEETLAYCSQLVGHDLTLDNIPNRPMLTTLQAPANEYVFSVETKVNDNFAGFSYDVQQMARRGSRTPSSERIVVPLDLATKPTCQLIVHGIRNQSDEMIIALEHVVRYLHIELLSQRNIDNLMYFNHHNLVDELLTNEELKPRNLTGIVRALGLGISPQYQVVQLTLLPTHAATDAKVITKEPDDAYHHDTLRIRNHLHAQCPSSVFHVTTHRIAMIVNIPPHGEVVSSQALRDCLPIDIAPYVAGISDVGGLEDLRRLRQQTQQIKDIQRVLRRYSTPMTYEELGIFKIFNTPEAIQQIAQYIPARFVSFQREHPTLFETVVTYIEQGRNSNQCAHMLVVHPKTVQYRLSRVRELNLVDLDDPDQVLQLLFASRVLPRSG